MANTLSNLPLELLSEIVEQLDTRELYRLGVCSQQFNKATMPYLYRHFTQTGDEALPAFTRLMLRSPHLGEQVQSLTANYFGPESRLSIYAYDQDDIDKCEGAIKKVVQALPIAWNVQQMKSKLKSWNKETQNWLKLLKEGSYDVVLAVLLTLLPNLRELSITDCTWDVHSNLGPNLRHVYKVLYVSRAHVRNTNSATVAPLENLHSASLTWLPERSGGAQDMTPFLNLPNLKEFRVSRMYMFSFFDEWSPASRPDYKMTDLHFEGCSFDGHALIQFFGCFSHLKRLHLDYGDWSVDRYHCEAQKVGEALAQLRPCLESLYLFDNLGWEKWEVGEGGEMEGGREGWEGLIRCVRGQRTIGSLAEFQCLHTVILQHISLFGSYRDEGSNEETTYQAIPDTNYNNESHGNDSSSKDNNSDESSGPQSPVYEQCDRAALTQLSLETLLPKSLKKFVIVGVPHGPAFLEEIRELAHNKTSLPFLQGVNVGRVNCRPSPNDLDIRGESPGFQGCDMEFTEALKDECKAMCGVEIAFSAQVVD